MDDVSSTNFDNQRRKEYLLLLAILFLAAFVRFIGINTEGLWLDEIMQVNNTMVPSFGDVWKYLPPDKPPLVYYEIYFLSKISLSEILLRTPPFIFGTLLVYLTMVLAKIIYKNRTIAYISGLIIALSPLCVQLSREILPYIQGIVFVMLSFIAAIKWLDTGYKRWLIFSFIAAAISLWTIFQSVASLVMLGIIAVGYIFLHRQESETEEAKNIPYRKSALLLAVILFLSFLSTFPMWGRMLSLAGGSAFWTAPPFNFQTVTFFFQKLSAGFDESHTNYIWVLFVLLLIIEGIWIFWHWRTQEKPLILFVWFLGGIILIYIIARIQKHWITSRYLSFFIPPFAIIVAAGIERIASIFKQGKSSVITKVLLTCLIIIGCLPTLIESYHTRGDFRGVARNLAKQAQLGDIALFQHNYDQYCYSYYRQYIVKNAPPSTFYQSLDAAAINKDFPKAIAQAKRVWVVEYVHPSFPIDPAVKDFFIPAYPKFKESYIRYRLETPENVIKSLSKK